MAAEEQELAEGQKLSATIPPEPPEWSIVSTREGRAYQRSDIGGSQIWYPALFREHGTCVPMTWSQLCAKYGQITIVRLARPAREGRDAD